jgi:hypothetical protein
MSASCRKIPLLGEEQSEPRQVDRRSSIVAEKSVLSVSAALSDGGIL